MSAPARDGGRLGVLWTSHRASTKLASAAIEGAQDLAVTAATQIARHPPYVDGPGEAEYANLKAGGVRLPGVAPPIAAVAENGEPPDVDVDAFRHVDVDVPERRDNRYRRLPLIHGGVAEIEVEVPEDAGGEGPPAQPEAPAPHDMAQKGRGETGRPAARVGRLRQRVRKVIVQMRQLAGDRGPQRCGPRARRTPRASAGQRPYGPAAGRPPARDQRLTRAARHHP